MSLSAGPGSPIYFMCQGCRRSRAWQARDSWGVPHDIGTALRVTLTGRTKPRAHLASRALGTRHTNTSYEYRCDVCSYLGWSTHIDLDRKATK